MMGRHREAKVGALWVSETDAEGRPRMVAGTAVLFAGIESAAETPGEESPFERRPLRANWQRRAASRGRRGLRWRRRGVDPADVRRLVPGRGQDRRLLPRGSASRQPRRRRFGRNTRETSAFWQWIRPRAYVDDEWHVGMDSGGKSSPPRVRGRRWRLEHGQAIDGVPHVLPRARGSLARPLVDWASGDDGSPQQACREHHRENGRWRGGLAALNR